MSRYPTPDQIELPPPDEISQDQAFYLGWQVQHNRLWLAYAISLVVNAVLVATMFLTTTKYRPAIQYVTLEGGYPVVWNDVGNVVVGGTEYVPARLRAVVSNFIKYRYEYDWQNPQKINTALALMSDDAQAAEREKFFALQPRETIVEARMKVELQPDYSNWSVVALGNGRFEVTVPGTARITDAVRNPDPHNPLVKSFTATLTIQTVPATDTNPLGYVIISTGRDIL